MATSCPCLHVYMWPLWAHITSDLPRIQDQVDKCVYRIGKLLGKLESNTTCLGQGKLHMHASFIEFSWTVQELQPSPVLHKPLSTAAISGKLLMEDTTFCMARACSITQACER